MRKFLAIFPLALTLTFPAGAADEKKADEPGITRQQADAILNELRQIRQLLEKGARPGAQPAPPGPGGKVTLNIGDSPVLGNKNAPVTMVEFTDYQCTFCQRFHTVTFPQIRKQFIDSGKVRFISRDLPLEFHSNAFNAALAARCAADQGKFWEMRDRLVANASSLSPTDIEAYAQTLGLKMPEFRSCVQSEKHAEAVRQDVSTAASLQIDGTPSFIIGKSTPEGVEGTVVMGALPLGAFEAKIKEASE